MRLIDADALLEAIENIKLYNVTPNQPVFDMNRVRADELIETINAQPTAFDVEKVVKEIDKESVWHKGFLMIHTEEAIDIVRKGGVE